MRRQKGLVGEPINVVPTYILVPPELETVAEQIVASVSSTSVDDVNPFTGKLKVIVDAYLSDSDRWYVVSRPGVPEGLQHAYLDGMAGPQIFTREGFDIDGIEFKVRLDFGAGFVDHRGWFSNPGNGS